MSELAFERQEVLSSRMGRSGADTSEAFFNTVSQGMQKKLLECCARGELKKLQNLLSASRVAVKDSTCASELLLEAARNGRRAIVHLLLEKGIPPDVRNERGCTPLILASFGGHLSTVLVLLQAGADPSARCQTCLFTSSLGAALLKSQVPILEALLETRFLSTTPGYESVQPDLHLAFSGPLFIQGKICTSCMTHVSDPLPPYMNQKSCIQLLLQHGVVTPDWEHPQLGGGVHLASEYGRGAVLSALIAAGAYVNGRVKGETPLLAAIRGGYPETLLLLLGSGADLNSPLLENSDCTPLLQCTLSAATQRPSKGPARRDHSRCLELLLQNLVPRDCDDSPTAEGQNHDRVMKALSLPPKLKDELDLSLIAASRFGLLDIVNVLIRAGADPNGGAVGTGVPKTSIPNLDSTSFSFGTLPSMHRIHSIDPEGGALGGEVNPPHSRASSADLASSPINPPLPTGTDSGSESSMDLSGFETKLRFGSSPPLGPKPDATRCLGVQVGGGQGGGVSPALEWECWWKPLQGAIVGGQVDCAKRLLREGADANWEDREGVRALCLAAARGDQPMLEALLSRRASWCRGAWAGGSAPEHPHCVLMRSVLDGQHRKWEASQGLYHSLLLRKPLPLMSADLHKSGLAEVLALVGLDSSLKPIPGKATPTNEESESLKKAVERGANLNAVVSATGHSLLHVLALCGRADQMAALLEADPSLPVNTVDAIDGVTPLHCAAAAGSPQCLKHLIARGANVNRPNRKGATPLHMAAMAGNRECLRVLLSAGGDPNRQEGQAGWSPLHVLCYYSSTCRVWKSLQELLVSGADAHAHTEDGRGCLHLLASSARGCASCRAEAICHLAGEYGLDPSAKDNAGMSARGWVERGALGKLMAELVAEGNTAELALYRARMCLLLEALSGLIETDPHLDSQNADADCVQFVKSDSERVVLNWPLQRRGPVSDSLVGQEEGKQNGDKCANPGCWVQERPPTKEHPGVQLMKCSLCLSAKYCSKACQVAHWKDHRPFCNARKLALLGDVVLA